MSGLGFVFFTGSCFICKNLVNYNPLTVPSTYAAGPREPLCRSCVEDIVNPLRIAQGLPPVKIAADAYKAVEAERVL